MRKYTFDEIEAMYERGYEEGKLLAECQAYLMELEDKYPTSRYDKRKELIERIARLFGKGGE